MKKLVNLAFIMIDKYLLFDNPVFRNSETEYLISDFQLKKSNINNVRKCNLHKTSDRSFQNNDFN